MLSLIDLIQYDFLSLELAAFLIEAVISEKNILIGSKPGAAGKTTLMGALLAFIPDSVQIQTMTDEIIKNQIQGSEENHKVFVIHEIGSGNWFGYYWGKSVIKVLNLLDIHTNLYSNMHPDTIEEVYKTFEEFGANSKQIGQFDLIIFINYNLSESPSRYIREVWISGISEHNLIWTGNEGFSEFPAHYNIDLKINSTMIKTFLKHCLDHKIHVLSNVASEWRNTLSQSKAKNNLET